MNKPHVRIRLDFSASCSIGPGKIALLEGIQRSGSLSAAARVLGMSYRRSWLLLHSINAGFEQPVVALSVGGKDGGGAQLTGFGAQLIADYREFEQAVDTLASERFAAVRPSTGNMTTDAGAKRRPVNRAPVKRRASAG